MARTYDPSTGRLASQTITKTGSSPVLTLASFALTYDPAGNLASKTSTVGANPANGTWTYSYDPLGTHDPGTRPQRLWGPNEL